MKFFSQLIFRLYYVLYIEEDEQNIRTHTAIDLIKYWQKNLMRTFAQLKGKPFILFY